MTTLCLGLSACDRSESVRAPEDQSNPIRTKSERARKQESIKQAEEAADKRLQIEKSVAQMDEIEKSAYFEDLIYRHATTDRELACVAYRMLQKQGEFSTQITAFLAAALAGTDTEEALDWLEELPAGEHRRVGYAQLCIKLAEESPRHAADIVTTTIPFNSESTELFVEISEAWAKVDPLPAAEWAGRFPQGEGRNSALVAVMRLWNKKDAEKWVQGIADQSLLSDAQAILDSTVEFDKSSTGHSKP